MSNPQHKARKAAAARKEKAKYKDGKGWERAFARRAKAALEGRIK